MTARRQRKPPSAQTPSVPPAITPLAGDFEVSCSQLLNPAFELDASVLGSRAGDEIIVTWQPYMPDEEWGAVEIGRFAVGTPFRTVVAALAARREDCCGPSFPSLDEAIVEWSAEADLNCAGVDETIGEWMVLVLADFEGESVAEVAAKATEVRMRALHNEHGTLLVSGALRYFVQAQRQIELRRRAQAARQRAA